MVTTPSNEIKTIEGTLRTKLATFYEPEYEFPELLSRESTSLDITVTHRGMTSAGLVEPPYPVGGILGEDVHSYKFYAVTKESEEAELAAPLPYRVADLYGAQFFV